MSAPQKAWRFDPASDRRPATAAEHTAYRVIAELASQPQFPIDEIAAALARQPRVERGLLQFANAATRRKSREIDNTRHAVVFLGARGLQQFCQRVLQERHSPR